MFLRILFAAGLAAPCARGIHSHLAHLLAAPACFPALAGLAVLRGETWCAQLSLLLCTSPTRFSHRLFPRQECFYMIFSPAKPSPRRSGKAAGRQQGCSGASRRRGREATGWGRHGRAAGRRGGGAQAPSRHQAPWRPITAWRNRALAAWAPRAEPRAFRMARTRMTTMPHQHRRHCAD